VPERLNGHDWKSCVGLNVHRGFESLPLRWWALPLRCGKGVPRISSKHQVTLPVEVLANAGLTAGDEVTSFDQRVLRALPTLGVESAAGRE
jgi:hypothetical protein